jgi:EAL domain-containing protein (putative c-di-GMP-specific phosphodiesterase class I)
MLMQRRADDAPQLARAIPQPDLLCAGEIDMMFQPIVEVATGAVVAAEALACFPSRRGVAVDQVFRSAYAQGWGGDLEAACLAAALDRRRELPAGMRLAINLSPDALEYPAVRRALRGDLGRVIIEVTEQAASDPDRMAVALADIRQRGGLVAIDDAGSGYSGLLRLSELRPHVVKIDRGLVTDCYEDDIRRTVIETLVSLARRIGAVTLGEGVESADDLAALAELNVDFAQGWAVGHPGPTIPTAIPEVVEIARSARAALLDAQVGPDSMSGMSHLTAALAATAELADLQLVIAAAAADVGVDAVGLSTLEDDRQLREITASGAPIDDTVYELGDFPATSRALLTATIVEAHLNDTTNDAAERALLARDGFSSVLITPVIWRGARLGILEFRHRTHRRWTPRDMSQARTVAMHVASVLQRLSSS